MATGSPTQQDINAAEHEAGGGEGGTPAAPVAGIPKPPLLLAGAVLAMSNFMVVLDLTIANVSIPHIAGDMAISVDEGTWILTSYAVAEAICVPLTGWLAQRFGAVRVFVLGMVGFGLFSMLCGLSVSLTMLVVCRIGQGLCGGPLMPMSQTLMLRLFPPEKRGLAMGIWATTVTLGPAFGPIIGGYISDNASWHWIFLINVPIAAICSFAAISLLTPLETPIERRPIDGIGLALMVFWIGCFQIMLDIGRDRDWFADPLVLALGLAALVSFAVFVVWELTEPDPMVDLRVFRHRGFTTAVMTLALCFGAYFSGVVVVPQWLQLSLGYTATKAGVVTCLQGIAAASVSAIAGRLSGKFDPRLLISASVVWLALMALLRTRWTSGADFWTIAIPMGLQGFALPFMFIPLTTVSLGSVLPAETASAAGLQNFVRTLAIAVSTSVVLTIWGDGQRVAQNDIAARLDPARTQAALAGIGFNAAQARVAIGNIVSGETAAMSIDHTFMLTAIMLFFAASFVWISPKVKPGAVQGGGGAH